MHTCLSWFSILCMIIKKCIKKLAFYISMVQTLLNISIFQNHGLHALNYTLHIKILYIHHIFLHEISCFFKTLPNVQSVKRQEKHKFVYLGWHLKSCYFQKVHTKRQTDENIYLISSLPLNINYFHSFTFSFFILFFLLHVNYTTEYILYWYARKLTDIYWIITVPYSNYTVHLLYRATVIHWTALYLPIDWHFTIIDNTIPTSTHCLAMYPTVCHCTG